MTNLVPEHHNVDGHHPGTARSSIRRRTNPETWREEVAFAEALAARRAQAQFEYRTAEFEALRSRTEIYAQQRFAP